MAALHTTFSNPLFLFHHQELSFNSKDHQLSACSTITQPASKKTYPDVPSSFYGFHRNQKQSPFVAVEVSPNQKISCSTVTLPHDGTDTTVADRLPPNVDPEVFQFLPKEIQMELLSVARTDCVTSVSSTELMNVPHTTESKSTESFEETRHFTVVHAVEEEMKGSEKGCLTNAPAGTSSSSGENLFKEEAASLIRSSDCEFPGNVDPLVFSELPLDVQQELISEWKQNKLVFKSPSSKKPVRTSMTSKDRKTAGKNRQANSLLNYFKPS